MARWAPGFCAGTAGRSAEGAPGGPQVGSSKRSMPCREATCACNKRQHVKTDPRRFSLQL